MVYAEEHGLLVDEQAGSRKRRRAAEVALQKVLTMDILRQQRKAGFLCSNDALQCYDRIVHNVAMLCLLSRGADPLALQSLFGTLQNAEHATMTGYGVSEETYGGRIRALMGLLPLMGILQGNGMGPFIWAFISSVLIGCMHSMGFASVLTGCTTCMALTLMGHLFVDDCDLILTAKDTVISAASLLVKFQGTVDAWEGVLRAT